MLAEDVFVIKALTYTPKVYIIVDANLCTLFVYANTGYANKKDCDILLVQGVEWHV